MAVDVDYAIELAERLNAENTGKIDSVIFSFDAFEQVEKIKDVAWAVITPTTLQENREAHQTWVSTFELLVTMLVKNTPNIGSQQWFHDNLTSWDMLVDHIKNDEKVATIAREFRYQPEQSQTQARTVAQAVVMFNFFD